MERVRLREVAREGSLIGVAMLAYFGVRNLTVGHADEALDNAASIARVEDRLHLAWETAIQGWIIDHGWLVALTNWVYIWGHWPVILGSAGALYLFRRPAFYLLRNAMFLSGALGLLFFALVPVAPPRLVDAGLIDTVTEQSQAYRAFQPPGLTNQYAAFPSLHVGWNVLLGIVLVTAGAPLVVRIFAVVLPAAMTFAVVATANHFVLDVVAGVALVVIAFLATRARAARDGDGAAPESNRPSRGLHDRNGFEDRLGHRAHAAPRRRLAARKAHGAPVWIATRRAPAWGEPTRRRGLA